MRKFLEVIEDGTCNPLYCYDAINYFNDFWSARRSLLVSVFDGVVSKIFTGPNGQQIVIIRHGEYLTVYTNLSSLNVSNGSKVSTKQKLGTVYTNSDNVSEFNFQVWKGNNRQNPSSWIR